MGNATQPRMAATCSAGYCADSSFSTVSMPAKKPIAVNIMAMLYRLPHGSVLAHLCMATL